MNDFATYMLDLAFRGFWYFIGVIIILAMLLNTIMFFWNRFWRHWNIRKHGYPPQWCDADGDFKTKEKEQ